MVCMYWGRKLGTLFHFSSSGQEGRKNQIFSVMKSMVDCPCFRGWPNTSSCISSTN